MRNSVLFEMVYIAYHFELKKTEENYSNTVVRPKNKSKMYFYVFLKKNIVPNRCKNQSFFVKAFGQGDFSPFLCKIVHFTHLLGKILFVTFFKRIQNISFLLPMEWILFIGFVTSTVPIPERVMTHLCSNTAICLDIMMGWYHRW